MRTEWKLFGGLGLSMVPFGISYWYFSYEEAGSLMLVVLAIAFLFMGTYLFIESKKMDGLRPEDYDATPADGAGEVGSFPVGSIWPLVGATGAMLLAFGSIFTAFIAIPGGVLIFATVIGMARESYGAQIGHLPVDRSSDPAAISPDGNFSDRVKK